MITLYPPHFETSAGAFFMLLKTFLYFSVAFFIVPGFLWLGGAYFYKKYFNKQNINFLGAKIIALLIPCFLLIVLLAFVMPNLIYYGTGVVKTAPHFSQYLSDYILFAVVMAVCFYNAYLFYKILKTRIIALKQFFKFFVAIYGFPAFLMIFLILLS